MESSIKTIVHDRQIIIPAPDEIADGTCVEVRLVPITAKVGLDEAEWLTDADSIRDWCEWLECREPVDLPLADDFDERFKTFNVQAVRNQMHGGSA